MAADTESAKSLAAAWLDVQKQYLDAWMKFPREAGFPGAAASPFAVDAGKPWSDAFDQWSRLFGQGMPGDARDISGRLFDLGRSYLRMSESFWQVLREGTDAAALAANWQEALKGAVEQFGKAVDFPGGVADPWSGFATLWGLPLSNWQRMAASFSPFPGEMERALREDRTPQPSDMTRAVRHYLSLPPVGYTREWQEQAQEWTRLSIEYTHAMQDFAALLGKVVQRALELFGNRMTEKVKAGESFDGLRAVYDLWIDCGEEAYAEQVATAEFPHLQAELVNALMRMKRHEQLMLDELQTAMNVPTRREMDTTHRRVYELQRQLRDLQDALEEAAEAEAASPPAARKASSPAGKTAARRKAATSGKTAVRKKAATSRKTTTRGKTAAAGKSRGTRGRKQSRTGKK